MNYLLLQLKAQDIIWLELKAAYDFELYVIVPGDEVFIPSGFWPKHPQRILSYPANQPLSKTLAYAQVQLTKLVNVVQSDSCNSTDGYVYGGKIRNLYKSLGNITAVGKDALGTTKT